MDAVIVELQEKFGSSSTSHMVPERSPASTMSPPSTPAMPHGSRLIEVLKRFLEPFFPRRPTREDLQTRGIYKDPTFGASLGDVCVKDKSTVPTFLLCCFREIERRGLHTEGIYRQCAVMSQIQDLRVQANQCEYDVSNYDIHVLAGAVKLFFRELREPLIPVSLLDRFIAVYRVDNKQVRCYEFIALIQQLPEQHRDTLAELLIHLDRVLEHSAENQMTARSLAIVFGPTLMWSTTPSSPHSLQENVVLQGKLVEYFITDRQRLFNFYYNIFLDT